MIKLLKSILQDRGNAGLWAIQYLLNIFESESGLTIEANLLKTLSV